MAQISIWPVTHHLHRCISYVMNPQKTMWEGKVLVSGVRLSAASPEIATGQMLGVKEQYEKTDGRLAYHLEQGFKPGEVDPLTAHEIGKRFAREAWGDRFQVVVCTHVDKNHLHNHYIVNSVSDADGKKYHESPEEYGRLRELSDRLCREYGLSVIGGQKKTRAKSYPELHPEQKKRPTVHTLIYQDMDNALEMAEDLDGFYEALKQMGYRVKRDRAHPAIAPPGKGYFRLYKFARGYTEEDIIRRLAEKGRRDPAPGFLEPNAGKKQSSPARQEGPGPAPRREGEYYTYGGQWASLHQIQYFRRRFTHYLLRRRHWRGLRCCFLQYRFVLCRVEDKTYPRYPGMELRRELYRLRQYSEEALLLCRNKIDTMEQLQAYTEQVNGRIHALNLERRRVRRKIRAAPAPEELASLQVELEALNTRALALYRERALCGDIAARSGMVERAVEQEREAALRERHAQGQNPEREQKEERI